MLLHNAWRRHRDLRYRGILGVTLRPLLPVRDVEVGAGDGCSLISAVCSRHRLFRRVHVLADLALGGGLLRAHMAHVVILDSARLGYVLVDVDLRIADLIVDWRAWTSKLCRRFFFDLRLLLIGRNHVRDVVARRSCTGCV